jgi:putative toxin-antitoxin system antitoxin component (TIGR02293 family)
MAAIREGLPVSVVDDVLADGRLTAAELDRLALPRKTLAHRRTLGRLTAEQSDRLVRILRVIEQAEHAFGDVPKARIWLRRPTAALADHAPLDLLDTDIGTRQVETLLGRIEHGIAA